MQKIYIFFRIITKGSIEHVYICGSFVQISMGLQNQNNTANMVPNMR
jgi:hypothetical protein